MSNDEKIITNIKNVIEKLKPFLINDGGMIDFVKFENGICYVEFSGACKDCSYIDYTLKDGIELAILSEVPEVIEVRNIDE